MRDETTNRPTGMPNVPGTSNTRKPTISRYAAAARIAGASSGMKIRAIICGHRAPDAIAASSSEGSMLRKALPRIR